MQMTRYRSRLTQSPITYGSNALQSNQIRSTAKCPTLHARRRFYVARTVHTKPFNPLNLYRFLSNPSLDRHKCGYEWLLLKGFQALMHFAASVTLGSKLPFAAPSVNICSGRKTSKQVRCVPNHVHPKLRQHSVSNTAIANTVFNTVIQRLKYSATRQKVCLWCVFEKHNLSVYADYLSHWYCFIHGAGGGRNRTTNTRIFNPLVDIFE